MPVNGSADVRVSVSTGTVEPSGPSVLVDEVVVEPNVSHAQNCFDVICLPLHFVPASAACRIAR